MKSPLSKLILPFLVTISSLSLAHAVTKDITPYAKWLDASYMTPWLAHVEAECVQGSQQPVGSKFQAIAQIAVDEHAQFKGHEINRDGMLWRYGNEESEMEQVASNPYLYSWEIVKKYWDTLEQTMPTASAEEAHLKYFKFHPSPNKPVDPYFRMKMAKRIADSDMKEEHKQVLYQSLYRNAITDAPWSAAFISYVVYQGGRFDSQEIGTEFKYSSMHSFYINPAIQATFTDIRYKYVYRACDPYKTRARPGDLICYTRFVVTKPNGQVDVVRSTPNYRNFVSTIMSRTGKDYEAHCDVVTAVNSQSGYIESVGGNVMNSVSRRQLNTGANGALDIHYLNNVVQSYEQVQNLNQKNWLLLLQSR